MFRSFHLVTFRLGSAALLLLGGGMLITATEANGYSDLLRFRSGDSLRGALKSFTPEAGVVWKHPDALEEIEFSPGSIEVIELGENHRPQPLPGANLCRLQVGDQDQLEGDLVHFDGETLLLDTWYAGRLAIPATQLSWIRPVIPHRVVRYEGPSGLDDWTMGRMSDAVPDPGEWRYHNGAFYAWKPASVARDLNLPDLASVQFDLSWRGTLHLAVALYTGYLHPVSLGATDAEPDFGGFYSLQFQRFTVDVWPITKENPQRRLGPHAIQSLNQKTSARIEVRVHKPRRLLALYVDGALVKQWVDTEAFAGTGTAVRFVHQGKGAIRLSNLRVAEWDGQLDEQGPDRDTLTEDLTRLRNGDRVAGAVASIHDGRTVINLGSTTLDVPFDRIRQIDFSSKNGTPAPQSRPNVRAHFSWGGTVAFQLERWTESEVAGINPALGPVRFQPQAFSKIELLEAE